MFSGAGMVSVWKNGVDEVEEAGVGVMVCTGGSVVANSLDTVV